MHVINPLMIDYYNLGELLGINYVIAVHQVNQKHKINIESLPEGIEEKASY